MNQNEVLDNFKYYLETKGYSKVTPHQVRLIIIHILESHLF